MNIKLHINTILIIHEERARKKNVKYLHNEKYKQRKRRKIYSDQVNKYNKTNQIHNLR